MMKRIREDQAALEVHVNRLKEAQEQRQAAQTLFIERGKQHCRAVLDTCLRAYGRGELHLSLLVRAMTREGSITPMFSGAYHYEVYINRTEQFLVDRIRGVVSSGATTFTLDELADKRVQWYTPLHMYNVDNLGRACEALDYLVKVADAVDHHLQHVHLAHLVATYALVQDSDMDRWVPVDG